LLSIIYPYRNRNLNHVQNSLESLRNQTLKEFEVYFVDYGSDLEISKKVKDLCKKYTFINYKYYSVHYQPWNKSRALNSVIKNLSKGFCFVADVDMIFDPNFIKKAIQLQKPNKSIYFQVGFLSPQDITKEGKFHEFQTYRKSSNEATGLSMFPVEVLHDLRGFDEFYHFWGAEDTDIHERIKNAGYQLEFYTEEILMLHQWHPSYRSKESSELTSDLQLGGIVALNHQHLKSVMTNKTTMVNPNRWGEIMSDTQFKELQQAEVDLELTNEKNVIDDLLYGQLPSINNRVIKIRINQSLAQKSFRYKTKKLLNKKVSVYYSPKEVNDLLLFHLISFYRDHPYNYKIIDSGKTIEFVLKFK